jgi:magnesium transporter
MYPRTIKITLSLPRGRLSICTNAQHQFHRLSGTLRMTQPMQSIPSCGRRGIVTLPNKSHHVIQEPDMKKEASFNQNVFNLSLALSKSRINDATELRCMVLGLDGSVKESDIRGTRDGLAKEWGLDGRDLRNVDLVSEGIPHLLVRPSVIFISMFTLRLLVRAHGVLLFLLPIEDCHVKVQDVFMTDLQRRLHPGSGSGLLAKLPFELRVVDAALASVIATLEAEHVLIRREVQDSLQDSTREDVVYAVLRDLQDHRKRLVAIQQRASQFRSALREILENDEDMATMFLTDRQAGRPHEVEDHLEVEYLLEAYYKNADAIAESANALLGDLERTVETIHSVLDVRRNQIMVFEAQLEICMLGFAVPTFVAGLFGMNVANFFEESTSAFVVLVAVCVMGTVTIAKYGLWKLDKFRKLRF